MPQSVRKLLFVAALLVSIGAELAVAEPLRVASAFRASICCVRVCERAPSVACQSDCCAPAKRPDTATISIAAEHGAQQPVFSALPGSAVVDLALAIGRDGRASSVSGGSDPSSLFLLTRALRL